MIEDKINCPKCKKEVKSFVKVCPFCGNRLKFSWTNLGFIIFAIVVFLVIYKSQIDVGEKRNIEEKIVSLTKDSLFSANIIPSTSKLIDKRITIIESEIILFSTWYVVVSDDSYFFRSTGILNNDSIRLTSLIQLKSSYK